MFMHTELSKMDGMDGVFLSVPKFYQDELTLRNVMQTRFYKEVRTLMIYTLFIQKVVY